MEIQKNPVTASGKKVTPVVWECVLPRGGVRLVHDGHQRARAAVVQRAGRRRSRPTGETITLEPMTQVPRRARPRRRPLAHVRGPEARQGVDRARRLARARPRPAPVAGEPGDGVPALALHDVRLLPRGVPAGQRGERLHRPRRAQPGAALQPAPERQDARGRAARLGDGRGRRRGVRQGAELRRGVPQGDPAGRLDRVGRPRRPPSACSSAGC